MRFLFHVGVIGYVYVSSTHIFIIFQAFANWIHHQGIGVQCIILSNLKPLKLMSYEFNYETRSMMLSIL